MSKTFYITTPIYYVNDVPHIGHAYTTIAADVLARCRRLSGDDVFFLTGLDEHGQKVQQAAQKAGIDPQSYCDQLAPKFQSLWKRLNISNNAFIRTSHPRHKEIVQAKLQELYDKKLIYKADYTGWYCTFDERFWTEKDVTDGLCPDCKRPVDRLSESNYFFRMGQYQGRLLDYIAQRPEFIRPEQRRNEVLGFLQSQKLGDLSISRPKTRLSWGIELPFDHNYVTYVWFDALVNYISALEYLTPAPAFGQYWPATIHLVGKDILTTHAVYWSTILMALELALPHTIFAHGWWTVNGEKMSKSRGNVVDPNAMIDQFGADAFRYFLLREVPFGHDGDFSSEALIGRINSDLANGLGNLLNRTLTMIEKYCHGAIPETGSPAIPKMEENIRDVAEKLLQAVEGGFGSSLLFKENLQIIWELISRCDEYIDKSAPWDLAKRPEDRPKLDTVLNTVAKALRFLCVLVYPYMPQTAEEMKQQLGLMLNFSKPLLAGDFTWDGLPPGTQIVKGKLLSPRIDNTNSQGDARVTQENQTQPTTTPPASTAAGRPIPPPASQITLEEFQRIALKTAIVLSAERVPRSDKLIKLQVDVGGQQLQIVAGIGKNYEPESLVGRRLVVVANLKPAKLMGVESQGMVLAAGDAEVLEVLTLQRDVPPGTKVK